ncbi:MAG: tetratricopeptide repeat protein [Candidatus Desulfofervidaceae bacterium]|nr:tetratricopeptide repeat protein [Candidatus Desulfofervidaceae bacterium]
MVTKIKKRKPITNADEFIALPNRIVDYVRDNLRQVVNIALALTLIVGLIFLGQFWWQRREAHVFLLYAQAESLLKQGQQDKAVEVLHKVADTHTKVAKFAILRLANIYEQDNKLDKAIVYYQDYIEKAGYKDLLSPLVLHALSCDYLSLGKSKEAETALQTIIKRWPNLPLTDWAYVNLGLLWEEKEPAKALEMYQLAFKDKGNPLIPQWVELKIKTLQ